MLGLTWMHRSAWLAALAGAGGCQISNPAFGLDPDTHGGSDSAGISASEAQTEPVLTTSSEPTTGVLPTTVEPGTGTDPGTTFSSEPPLTSSSDTHDTAPSGCGDGVLDPGEACDDGDGIDTNDCTNKCTEAECGDGIVHDGHEACDGGGVDDDQCTAACTVPKCGDGVVTASEQCDDANDDNFDGCSNDCTSSCQNRVFEPDREECDPTDPVFAELDALCTKECRLDTCFRMTNTAEEDFAGPDWFDACASAAGERIAVLLRDHDGVQYLRFGLKPPSNSDWTPANMTSTKSAADQWKFDYHDRKIVLTDLLFDKPGPFVDVLYAFGKTGQPKVSEAGICPSSLGDGYALAIASEDAETHARVLLMPFAGKSMPRNLGGWADAGAGVELAFDGAPMPLCGEGPAPFLGTVAVAVF
ncbi:DUF4215 domain-containing protein [Nannocystis punicea]|uniref:DUF4215 domain-containing protein n=1 Tax=Nannocystis punicea TaxID=2995304 RepID=A0ABY7HHS1_9BACT|nr:DUF4215 domain-containing protein [Nannocystis poenicansa]WAS98876.1 DUF4215 domain-containing protein [Nannocystis poenicansa]